MLWLLLLTSGVTKWANPLPVGGELAMSVVQIGLASGVAFLLAFAVIYSGMKLAHRWQRRMAEKRRAARAARGSGSSTGSSARSGGSLSLRARHSILQASALAFGLPPPSRPSGKARASAVPPAGSEAEEGGIAAMRSPPAGKPALRPSSPAIAVLAGAASLDQEAGGGGGAGGGAAVGGAAASR